MKIDSSLKSVGGGPVVDDTGRSSRKTPTDAATAAGDSVQISPMSSSLHSIEKGFADTPVVNTARVDEIKQAIASGHFKVDAGKVADRLIKTAQDLILAHKA